mgnify:CR=1 FL=1
MGLRVYGALYMFPSRSKVEASGAGATLIGFGLHVESDGVVVCRLSQGQGTSALCANGGLRRQG